MNAIIELDGLSKVFYIPHEERATIAESIIGAISKGKVKYERLYALKNISLDIRRGEFVGIIGSNGSGKTTLLKVIAGILEPDNGSAVAHGRIVSFLELGIGFVQELTTKENIYLYGSLLGLARQDVDRKMDAIVRFSGLKRFLDTPIKDLSTGMLARLAFSIAREVDADIYLIDEVLSVGDEAFQKKCLNVFKELKSRGKTVLFVSHNLDLINQVCERTIMLEDGRLIRDGASKATTLHYCRSSLKKEKDRWDLPEDRKDRDDESRLALKEVQDQLAAERKERKILAQELTMMKEDKDALAQERTMLSDEKKAIEKGRAELASMREKHDEKPGLVSGRKGTGEAKLTSVEFYGKAGKKTNVFSTDSLFRVVLKYNAKNRIESPMIGIGFYDMEGRYITGPNTIFSNFDIPFIQGKGEVTYTAERLPLLPGEYLFSAAIHDRTGTKGYDWHDKMYKIRIRGNTKEKYGFIRIPCAWEHKPGGRK